MPTSLDTGRSLDPYTDIPLRSSVVIKAEISHYLQRFVDGFNHEYEAVLTPETALTVEELMSIEHQYSVHHVLNLIKLFGLEFRAHLDDPPGESLQAYQGGWTAAWEAKREA